MKKVLLFLMMIMLAACSAPMPGEEVAETQEALIPSCSIVGAAGVADSTYITAIRILDSVGAKLSIDYLDPVANVRDTAIITFKDAHFAPFHTVNGTEWLADGNAYPLRVFSIRPPGCESNFPNSYCLFMKGDRWAGDHVNLLQNVEVFLLDRQVIPNGPTTGTIEAPVGFGISRIEGMGTTPTNTLRVSWRSSTGVSSKDYKFETSGCPFP